MAQAAWEEGVWREGALKKTLDVQSCKEQTPPRDTHGVRVHYTGFTSVPSKWERNLYCPRDPGEAPWKMIPAPAAGHPPCG